MANESVFDPARLFDATVCDPPVLDPDFPPEQFVRHFISQGSVVHATIWIAQGAAPRGTAILSPQMFGGDRLESLIIPMMASGMNVITFHPRGMWDNQHVYSLNSAVDDILAAAEYIRSTADGSVKTPRGNSWRTDPSRIVCFGLSGGGGNASLVACAEDPQIQGAIAIGANSMIGNDDHATIDEKADVFEGVKIGTAGRIDMVKIMKDMTPEEHKRMSPIAQAPNLVDKKVLVIGAQHDVVSPIETSHKPMVRAMREAGVTGLSEAILATDHAFLSMRIALARVVIGWLRSQCGF